MNQLRSWISDHRPYTWAVVLLLGIAFALRLFALDAYPPGVQHDEVFVANFAETILQGNYPIFFELNRGNEPLFMYMVAVAFKLFGENVWALRGTAALCGFGALVITFLLARYMFALTARPLSQGRRGEPHPNLSSQPLSQEERGADVASGDVIALLTAAGITFSFWHLYESRIGLHTISTFLLAAATFYAFWRGWTRGSVMWLIGSGVLAGLATYTYRSGIFVPVTLFVFIVYSFIFHRQVWGKKWWIAPVILVIAALIYAPLGFFIYTHPDTALARLGDLSGDIDALRQGNPVPLVGNAVRVLGMFGVSGDPEWRYNVAGRPIFDPLWAMSFYAGIVIALWRIKRAPYAFTLIWLGVMLLPSILSGSDLSQHRAVGAMGAAFILPALTFDVIESWFRKRAADGDNVRLDSSRRRPVPKLTRVTYMLAAVLILIAAAGGLYAYFVTWTNNAEVRLIQRADLAEAARWLRTNAQDAPVLVSAEFANDLDRGSFNLEAGQSNGARFFQGIDTFVIPASRSVFVVNPRSGRLAQDFERTFLSRLSPVYSDATLTLLNQVEIYHLDDAGVTRWQSLAPHQPLAFALDGQVAILGASLPEQAERGKPVRVWLWWRINQPRVTDADALTWNVALTDAQNYVWSESAGLGYTPSQWQQGDTIVSAFNLDIPYDAPPRDYAIRLGLTSRNGTIAIKEPGKDTLQTVIALGKIRVTRGAVPEAMPDLPIRYPFKSKFSDSIQLLGSDAVGEGTAGGTWQLVLFWKAESKVDANYTVRLTATTDDGQEITEQEELLLKDYYPTARWRAGEYIRSVHDLAIPKDAPRGKAIVRVSLWTTDGKPVGRADGAPIAGIEIVGRARNFTRPNPQMPRLARFGDAIELLGYSISPSAPRPNEPLNITLYWHALNAGDKPYTVFVHLLNANNQVIGQKDAVPIDGQAPTDSWQEGEYLEDTYNLVVAAEASGSAALEVGFYDPQSLQRLPAFDEQGQPIGDRVLIEGLALTH